jgi:hypothetical protein
LLRVAVCPDLLRLLRRTAVAAADNQRMPAASGKLLRQRKCERGFAGSADTDVADHDDRHGQFMDGQDAAAV